MLMFSLSLFFFEEERGGREGRRRKEKLSPSRHRVFSGEDSLLIGVAVLKELRIFHTPYNLGLQDYSYLNSVTKLLCRDTAQSA